MIEASRSLGKLVGQMRRMADEIPHVDLEELDNEINVVESKKDRDRYSAIHDESRQGTSDKNIEDLGDVDAPVPFRSDVDRHNTKLDIDPESVSKSISDRDSGSAGL